MGTLLIADDSAAKRSLLRAVARRWWKGAVVDAQTTEEAEALLEMTPDLRAAFVDYYMPSRNGPALIAAIRGRFPHAKIALVSSAQNETNFAEARAAGADTAVCSSTPEVSQQLGDLLHQWVIELGEAA